VLVTGCAGSGKTFLALEQARRLARAGYSVLLVCAGAPLASWLRYAVDESLGLSGAERERVTVGDWAELCAGLARAAGILDVTDDPKGERTIYRYVPDLLLGPCWEPAVRAFELAAAIARGLPAEDTSGSHIDSLHGPVTLPDGISAGALEAFLADALHHALDRLSQRFDALLVDEAHRVPGLVWTLLPRLLVDADRSPIWAFGDDNALVAGVYDSLLEVDDPGRSGEPGLMTSDWVAWVSRHVGQVSTFRLDQCFRNTVRIQERALQYYLGPAGLRRNGPEGHEPEVVRLAEGEDLTLAIDRVVDRLVRRERVSPRDITVLTPCMVEDSALPDAWVGAVSGLRYRWGAVATGLEPATVRVAAVADFRGLESPVVVLVEMDRLEEVDYGLAEDGCGVAYLALTRASTHLVVIGDQPFPVVDLGQLAGALWERWRQPGGLDAALRPRAEESLRVAYRLLHQWPRLLEDEPSVTDEEIDLGIRPPLMGSVWTASGSEPMRLASILEPWMIGHEFPEALEGRLSPEEWRAFCTRVRAVEREIRQILLYPHGQVSES
jgi:hypothetical protein